MKKQYLLFLLCFSLVVFLYSCQKDNNSDNGNAGQTKTQLLTSGSWKFSTAFVGSTDVSNTPQITCFKDNIISFSANLSGNIDEAVNVCSPSTAGAFTWNFASGETILHISTVLISGGSNDFTLVSLSATQLVVSQNYPPYGVVTVTFTH